MGTERTGAVLCLKGLGRPPYRHSFIPGNGLNRRREEQSRPSVQGFCSLILLKIAGAPAPIAGWQRWTVEGCQRQRFVSPHYISHSSEIWDRYRAWLESWIRKWPCTSGGIFSTNPRLSVCSRPHLRLAPFAKASSYTFSELTSASAKATTNYIKKATAVTAASTLVESNT